MFMGGRHLGLQMMKQALPVMGRRIGTALAVWLVAQGGQPELVDQIVVSLGVVGGLAFDVMISIVTKRKPTQ